MAKTLLAQAKSVTLGKKHIPSWFDKLDYATKAQVIELIDTYLSGELARQTGQNWTATDICKLVLEPNGINISTSSFRKWIAKYAKDAATASAKSATKRR